MSANIAPDFQVEESSSIDQDRPVDAWLTPRRMACLLGLLLLAAFPQVLLGLETFVFRDYYLFGYPLAFYHKQMLFKGEIPFWNPYNSCGLPFLAQWNTLVFYPGTLIYLLLPLTWGLGFYCLFHQFLAGLGMYFLAQAWTRHRLAAGIAGVAFAFNGLVLNCLMWPNNIAAIGLMPWVVWLGERAFQRGGRPLIIAALVAGAQILAGAPEMVIFTWCMVLVVWILHWFNKATSRNLLWRRLLILGGLALGLVAVQLLPFADLLWHSQRDAQFNSSEWALPSQGWANFFVPNIYCQPIEGGPCLQVDQYWTSSYYLGIGVMLLAVLGAWRSGDRRARWLALVAFFCLLMAFGKQTPIYDLCLTVIPLFRLMRYPVKFLVPILFITPLLCAWGIAWWRQPATTKSGHWISNVLLVAVGFSAVLIVILTVHAFFPAPDQPWLAVLKNGLARGLFLWLIAGWALLLARPSVQRYPGIMVMVWAVFFWLDALTHIPQQNPTVALAAYEPGFKHPDMPRAAAYGESRLMQSAFALDRLANDLPSDTFKGAIRMRLALASNCNLLDGWPTFTGLYSLYLRDAYRFLIQLYRSPPENSQGMRDFLGVALTTAPGKLFEYQAETNYLPMITGGQKPLFVDSADQPNQLLSPGFNAREVVFLSPEAQPHIVVSNRTRVEIVSSNLGVHRLELKVKADQASMLVIAQNYYHPWHAYVDGQRTELWRANYAYQALEVPSGLHQVEVVYEDYRFYAGTLISLLTLVGCGVAWVRKKY